jgi:phosphate:Na+ symporter
MGINLGTCVTTALVCSIGSSKDAKRTGIVHIVFNSVGTVLFMIVMTIIQKLGYFSGLWDSTVDSGAIADFQTIFNLLTAIALIPFVNILVKIACKIVKDEEEEEVVYPELAALDRKLFNVPAVAFYEVTKVAAKMAEMAKENLSRSLLQFKEFDENRSAEILEAEDRLDKFTDRADNYLIELSGHIDSESDNRKRNALMQCIRDVERIGDYATNFDEMAKKLSDAEATFSKGAWQEMHILNDAVQEILRLTVEAISDGNEYVVRRIEPLEEVIDDMVILLKERHTARLCEGTCSIDSGLVFMDLLTYFERTADQCSSIAMMLLGMTNGDIIKNHHSYLEKLHKSSDQSYLAEQENRRVQYLVSLENIKY